MSGAAIIATGGFNTGRLYTQHGQRIWWAQRADGWLFFKDVDRMLSGWLKREGTPGGLVDPIIIERVLPRWIMRQYDGGQYEAWAPPGEVTANNPTMPEGVDFGPGLRL